MKDWILYSLKCRKSQAGFALPVAIGMGLIILLVGLTMLLRSQDSQVSAIAQKDTAKSLNAAETGVNEIRALMNQHRAIANYPACTTDLNTPPTRNADGTCSDSGNSTESWALPNNIPNILAECGINRTAEIVSLANREWQNINPSEPSQGQYRLLTYDDQNSTLRVQGRVNEDQPSESISELEVDFSVEEFPLAGLWVANDATVGSINTDIVGSCSSSITALPQNNHFTKNLSILIPGIPSLPTLPAPSLPLRDPTNNTIQLDSSISEYFNPIGLETPNNSATNFIDVNANQNVEIWVDGNIDLQNTVIRCGGSPENCQEFQVKIYGQGSGNILLNKGTVLCNVFIHAPSHNVNNTSNFESNPGGGLPTTPNICGTNASGREIFNTSVFWVNSWSNNGNVHTPVLDNVQEINPTSSRKWSNAPINILYPPQLNPIQAWGTNERSVN
ncbi:hypothetical protein [Acaryochloris marina]|uniref:Type 4 fimbrial biogenesis protein PilX N-terminal domain-containing protein n=1 Tax=Acaryochloris marina (strain MBIC 11017) TaxID=329726 RepID=B0BZ14_ACAM1|nr:hypothetical protein [Acaryochloris marina]ABW28314.1 conserved hypothetical protein [Acaryochloris marina MBIC11017]BDM77339.1 hypothetical protein AM10699_02130 [Acaryochloris marina MBIC10699]